MPNNASMRKVVAPVVVSRHACLVMAASACEVFPKECCGVLCKTRRGLLAFPIQIAARSLDEVSTGSYKFFDKLFYDASMSVVGDFHSHCDYTKRSPTSHLPSETDLDNMYEESIEVILLIRRLKRARAARCMRGKKAIIVHVGKFSVAMRCFKKIKGVDRDDVPLFVEGKSVV